MNHERSKKKCSKPGYRSLSTFSCEQNTFNVENPEKIFSVENLWLTNFENNNCNSYIYLDIQQLSFKIPFDHRSTSIKNQMKIN